MMDRRSNNAEHSRPPTGSSKRMCKESLVEGAPTTAFDEPTAESVGVGQGQSKYAARLENPATLCEEALSVVKVEVLQRVRGVDSANAPSLKRKTLSDIEAADPLRPRSQVTWLEPDETVECPFGARDPVKYDARGAVNVYPSRSRVQTAPKVEHHVSHSLSLFWVAGAM